MLLEKLTNELTNKTQKIFEDNELLEHKLTSKDKELSNVNSEIFELQNQIEILKREKENNSKVLAKAKENCGMLE